MPNFSRTSLRKTQTSQNRPNQKPNQPNQLKPHGLLSYFCDLSLYAKCQLSRSSLSYISMVEEEVDRKRTSWGCAVPSSVLAGVSQVYLSLTAKTGYQPLVS